MASTQKPDVTPEEINKAKNLWDRFTKMVTWCTIVTIAVLALMALTLL